MRPSFFWDLFLVRFGVLDVSRMDFMLFSVVGFPRFGRTTGGWSVREVLAENGGGDLDCILKMIIGIKDNLSGTHIFVCLISEWRIW